MAPASRLGLGPSPSRKAIFIYLKAKNRFPVFSSIKTKCCVGYVIFLSNSPYEGEEISFYSSALLFYSKLLELYKGLWIGLGLIWLKVINRLKT